MSFGDSYLKHLNVLGNVGTPVECNGQKIVPIQFLAKMVPDPSSLGPRTKSRTFIGVGVGVGVKGIKEGEQKTIYCYNTCDHKACYQKVGSQAIS